MTDKPLIRLVDDRDCYLSIKNGDIVELTGVFSQNNIFFVSIKYDNYNDAVNSGWFLSRFEPVNDEARNMIISCLV